MLALAKQSHVQDVRLRTATWNDARLVRPVDLAGRRVLVLGLGRIGRLLAARLRTMEMEVLVHDPFVADAEIAAAGATATADWRAALPEIDFLTVNCPKTPETTGMVGAAELAAMKTTAFVVNTARGGIIDEAALHAALRDRAIGGAGIDAFRPGTGAARPPAVRAGQRHLHAARGGADHRGGVPDERARRPQRGRRVRRRPRPGVRSEPRSPVVDAASHGRTDRPGTAGRRSPPVDRGGCGVPQ